MFAKITRLNRNGEEREFVVNTDNLIDIVEIDGYEKPSKYDVDTGEVVETERVRYFAVQLVGGASYKIDFENYQNLLKTLGC